MALLRCDFFSDVLDLNTSMTVILPQRTSTQIGLSGVARTGDHPTLYLLHGLSDDGTAWLRRTSVERYVAELGLAVVMPQVGRSFYTDEAYGNRYWTFLTEELPAITRSFFHLSDRREDTFVAGLSMGGYGAFKWALRQPGRFAAAASFSGALDVAGYVASDTDPMWRHLWRTVFGDRTVAGSDDDLMALVGLADPAGLPDLYLSCGTEDRLYESNVAFVTAARDRGIPITVDFGPGGHDWAYWDARLQDALAWLRPRLRPAGDQAH